MRLIVILSCIEFLQGRIKSRTATVPMECYYWVPIITTCYAMGRFLKLALNLCTTSCNGFLSDFVRDSHRAVLLINKSSGEDMILSYTSAPYPNLLGNQLVTNNSACGSSLLTVTTAEAKP